MLLLFCGNFKKQLTFRVLHHFKQKSNEKYRKKGSTRVGLSNTFQNIVEKPDRAIKKR